MFGDIDGCVQTYAASKPDKTPNQMQVTEVEQTKHKCKIQHTQPIEAK
jgi:hypothetical protein